jgi:hypothetical protein
MKCIVKEGERWSKCSYHLNSKGGHGEYSCIYLDHEAFIFPNNKQKAEWDCNRPQILDDEMFEI